VQTQHWLSSPQATFINFQVPTQHWRERVTIDKVDQTVSNEPDIALLAHARYSYGHQLCQYITPGNVTPRFFWRSLSKLADQSSLNVIWAGENVCQALVLLLPCFIYRPFFNISCRSLYEILHSAAPVSSVTRRRQGAILLLFHAKRKPRSRCEENGFVHRGTK
jgi:hypothetical protein